MEVYIISIYVFSFQITPGRKEVKEVISHCLSSTTTALLLAVVVPEVITSTIHFLKHTHAIFRMYRELCLDRPTLIHASSTTLISFSKKGFKLGMNLEMPA